MIIQMRNEHGEVEVVEVGSYLVQEYRAKNCLQKFSYMLIRPPRVLYNEELLRPQNQLARRFTHSVFHVPFPLSLYEPARMRYVLLYLHGNASSRLEGLELLSKLPSGAGLACFDFDGCGNRLQGEFITLGKRESAEVDVAAAFLRGRGHQVVGWGRSMGSVSLLLSAECQVVVADSPFSSLRRLCYEHTSSSVPYPCKPCFCCLFPCLLACVGLDIARKTKMQFGDLEVIDRINTRKNRSILFLAATDDTLISSRHSEKLYRRFEGRKKLMLVEGDHNSERTLQTLLAVYEWIDDELAELEAASATDKKSQSSSLKSLAEVALMADYQRLDSANNSTESKIPEGTAAVEERVEAA